MSMVNHIRGTLTLSLSVAETASRISTDPGLVVNRRAKEHSNSVMVVSTLVHSEVLPFLRSPFVCDAHLHLDRATLTRVCAFTAGRQHGIGRYSAPNGDAYDGEWDNGRRHGHAVGAFVCLFVLWCCVVVCLDCALRCCTYDILVCTFVCLSV